MSAQDAGASGAPTPDLAEEVSELRRLFQRRLLDDRPKNQLIDDVRRHLAEREALDRGEAFAGLFQELLLAVDRLRAGAPGDALNASVVAEFLEILARRGVSAIPASGAPDPDAHEIVGAVKGSDSEPGTIIEVRRPGYVLGGRLLRPAQVVVAADPEGD